MYIVTYTVNPEVDVHVDDYSTFEDFNEAWNFYQETLKKDDLYISSLTAVIASTDYPKAPELEGFEIKLSAELIKTGEKS